MWETLRNLQTSGFELAQFWLYWTTGDVNQWMEDPSDEKQTRGLGWNEGKPATGGHHQSICLAGQKTHQEADQKMT